MTSSTPDALWASRSVRLLRPAAVACSGLRRRGAGDTDLNGINLALAAGARAVVVSQPDGAASVLLRVLAGLLRPDGGSVRLAGLRRADDSPRGWSRRVAYVGPAAMPYPWLSPAEVLELAGRLAGMSAPERGRRVPALVEHHRLGGVLQRPIRRAGPAVAQRTALAAGLLTDPEVLLLDEPLSAEEPEERTRLLQIPGLRRTVLIASRLPAQESGLFGEIILLRDGRMALHQPLRALQALRLPLSMRGILALADARTMIDGRPAVAAGGG